MYTVATLIAAASIDVDITALFMAALFLVLLFILKPLIIDPYLRARAAREAGVEGARAEAEKQGDVAESTMLKYEEEMRAARREASEVRESLRNQGVAEQADLVAEAREEIAAKLATEREKLQVEVASANKQLEERARGLADVMVDKIMPTVN